MADELPSQLESAVSSGKAAGVRLPPEFVAFIADPDLHEHLRSWSACFLDVAESVLPLFGGHLLRFLADQQGCAFWYLFINHDGDDHCVVSSFEYFDAEEMDYEVEDIEESDFQFQAESLEAFLSRFWIENEILFAQNHSARPPDVDPRFLKMYAQPGA